MMTTLDDMAISLNELYNALRNAGFTKKQAFKLVQDQWRLGLMRADSHDE